MSGVIMKESGKALVEVLVARRLGRNMGGKKSDVRLECRRRCG